MQNLKVTSKGEIILADEISPDTCRLRDIQTGKILDKDIFRQELGSLVEGYTEVLTIATSFRSEVLVFNFPCPPCIGILHIFKNRFCILIFIFY